MKILITIFLGVVAMGFIFRDVQPFPTTEITAEVQYVEDDGDYTPPFTFSSSTSARVRNNVTVDFILDPSYPNSDNLHEIISVMNSTYAEAGIRFQSKQILAASIPLPSYNLRRCSRAHYGSDLSNADIIVYLTGEHHGDVIGNAACGGYWYPSRNIAYVDITVPKTIQGRANAISHEVGHLFGLKHCALGSLMQPLAEDTEISFSEEHIKYLLNLKL